MFWAFLAYLTGRHVGRSVGHEDMLDRSWPRYRQHQINRVGWVFVLWLLAIVVIAGLIL